MKKYIVLTIIFIVFSLLLTGCKSKKKHYTDLETIRNRGYIIVGVKTDSAPFGYYNSNHHLVGIDIEIAKQIANNIFNNNVVNNIRFVPVLAGNKISKLNTKEVDILVATMSINDKRKLVINFSAPYFSTGQKLMVRKDSNITSLTYFNSKGKLCVVIGTTGEKILRLVAPNAYVVGVKTYYEARKLLKTKKVDAIFGDDCLLAGLNDGSFKLINRAYSREFYGVALRKSEDSKELLEIVNQTIAELLDTKQLNIIKRSYIKQDI